MLPSDPIRQALAEASQAHRQGRLQQAEKLYRRVLDSHPEQPEALHYLGLLAHQTGRDELALGLLAASVAHAPGNPAFHYNYAGVLAAGGRHHDAVQSYQRALELAPRDADAWHGLASALQAMACDEDAIACWQRGLAVDPAHAASLRGLADAWHALNRSEEELAVCRRLQEVERGSPASSIRLAEALVDANQPDAALELLESLLQRHRDLPDAHSLKGVILSTRGEFVPARRELEAAIALAPGFHEAVNHLVAIHTPAPDEPWVRRMLARSSGAAKRELPEAVSAEFALGKIFEDAKDYDTAFRHYAEGNRLYRSSIRYSTDSQRDYFERLRQGFGAGFQRRAVGTRGEVVPLFIVGMPRSGTTLVEQILAAHPGVHAGGELTALSRIVRGRIGGEFVRDMPGAVAALDDAGIAGMGREYLDHLRRLDAGAGRVTDKMPSNFMQVGLISALFPDAVIVHTSRDPVDTCVSCYTNLFRNGQSFSYDLKELGEFYRLYTGMMAFWEELLPGRIHRVQYEELVEDLEGQSRRLVQHCGLEWDPRCLAFGSATNAVRTASVYQVRQPVYKSSVQRWRRFEKHLGPLLGALETAPLR